MFYEASYAKKLLAGLSYQAFQADSILRQQLLRIEREKKKGQASLRFNCAFLLSNSVAVKWTAGGAARRRAVVRHTCATWRSGDKDVRRARADVPLPCMLLLCRPLKHCNNVVCWPVFYYVQEKVKLAPDDFDPLAYFYCLTRALSNKV